MRDCSYKVKGFTIAELCIAMVLSGILVSMAYLAYSYINKEYLKFNRVSNQIAEGYRCVGVLHDQFWKADSVYYIGDSLILYSKDQKIASIFPHDEKYCFKQSNKIDTFLVTLESLLPQYRNPENIEGRICSCNFTFLIEKEKLQFILYAK